MCILCVIQKWSRRVATMLPWLVIPLIGLWAFSQLLPPAFRFEITSPRLACIFVLLVTLFWYEILMPHLSSWRAHRNERLRERKRVEAIKLQKLRKTATKRCRNCLTSYKDQNPGCGRFMCSYCGHISKRPVLDIFLPPGFSNSRMKDLIGKSGKIMNGKMWTDSGWIHGRDWLENGNWSSGPVEGMSSYWRKNENNIFGGDENCFAEKSYSCAVIFVVKLLASFFLSIQWLWRKIFGFSSTREDFSSDTEHQGTMATRGENGLNFQESKGEKARRKAEEKRLARLEKELLEEEERKQREEVARLVEEQRRLRDEKAEAERDRAKASFPIREKDSKKESEKRRQGKRKEKDRGSSKSNSDAEELEKRAGKENEKKCDFDRKSDHREIQKSEGAKGLGTEIGYGTKNNAANNSDRGNAGNRYFDRMRGSIWSSSKAFSGGSIFQKIAGNATTANKEEKSLSSIERVHTSNNWKDMCPRSEQPVKHSVHVDDKSSNGPVLINQQPRTSPKKSQQQLFTRSSPIPPTTNVSVISRPTPKSQPEVYSPPFHGQSASPLSSESPIIFGQHAPFTLSTYPDPSVSTSVGFSPAIEPIFCHVQKIPQELVTEEPELFEDPCYIPDPVSLLGPVSESLENFQLDKGTCFGIEIGGNRPIALQHAWVSTEVNKPSPIESPLSREKHNSYLFRTISKAQDSQILPIDDVNTGAKEEGTWQMWNSSPLGQDALGLVGSPASWFLPLECDRSSKDDFILPSSQKTMASLFKKDDQVLSGTLTHHNVVGCGQGDGTFSPVTGCKYDPWLKKAVFPPISCTENHYALKPPAETTHSDIIYGSPRTSVINHPFEPSQAHCWSKIEQNLQSPGGGTGKLYVLRPSVGGLTPDIESLWSFDSIK